MYWRIIANHWHQHFLIPGRYYFDNYFSSNFDGLLCCLPNTTKETDPIRAYPFYCCISGHELPKASCTKYLHYPFCCFNSGFCFLGYAKGKNHVDYAWYSIYHY